MKKAFLLWIVVVMLAGGLSAQEVKIGNGTLLFNGKVASGVFFDSDDAVKESRTGAEINNHLLGEDGRVRMWNDSDTEKALRGDITGTYTNGDIGFRIRLRADWDPDTGENGNAIGRYAYGWVNFFNQGLKFTGGFIDLSDNVWGTLGDGDWDIGGNGVRVELQPFQFFNLDPQTFGRLNLGAFFMAPTKENGNIGRDDQGRPVYRKVTPGRFFEETVLGLGYTHPWFYARIQFQLDSDVDGADVFKGVGNTITAADKVWSGAEDESRFMFGAGFTMLPELKLMVEGNFEGLGNWEARGTGDLRQTLSYSFSKIPVSYLDRLTVGVKAKELLWGYNLREHIDWPLDLNPWIQIKPFVKYQITPEFSAGLETGFGGGHLVLGSLIPGNSNTGNANTKERSFVNEKSNIFIKPNFAFNLGGGLAVDLWYKVTFITYQDLGDDPMFKDLRQSLAPKETDNINFVDHLTKHQVALEFVWTF